VVCRPSNTLSVMIVLPDAWVTGVTVSVRAAPLPPRVMSWFRTTAAFDETR
jgi:hypothetical protein